MSSEETIDLINSDFPANQVQVERLWRENRSFRELCEAYRECREACRYWRTHGDANSDRRTEYDELLANLYEDIARFCRQAGAT